MEEKIDFSHRSVLLDECMEGLAIRPEGIYIDGTAGGAGHSSQIAKRLVGGGRLIALDQDADAFAPEKTFLEPCCGEGVFVLEILRRKYERCKTRKDYTTAIKSVYAMELQADNVEKTIAAVMELCEATFRPTKEEREIIKDHVIQADSLKVMRMINDMNERESQ